VRFRFLWVTPAMSVGAAMCARKEAPA
jgi:hypothetical protein